MHELNEPMLDRPDLPGEQEEIRLIRSVTWIGLGINLALSAIKFAAGILGRSQAVTADAVHSLSDSATDIAVLIGAGMWAKPPDETHPYGHRRIETLVTIFIGVALVGAGVGLFWGALKSLKGPAHPAPGWAAFCAALLSIVVKEYLYRWTAAAGWRIKSVALAANAWHHRTDAFSSIPAAFAVGIAALLPSWTFVDHVGAAIVSIFILQAAVKIMWPGLQELIDAGAPAKICAHIESVASGVEGVEQIHKLRTRYVGSRLHVDLHAVVDSHMSVYQGHEIAHEIKGRVMETDIPDGPRIIDVTVHIEPRESAI